MNKEEKEAIELLKQEPDFSLSYYKREYAIDIVLKLVDKQQKELEELKKYKQYYETEKIIWNRNDYISKDKIREFISKYSKIAVTEEKNVYSIIEEKDMKKELLGE